MFLVNGKLVNFAGKEVDQAGDVIEQAAMSGEPSVERLQAEVRYEREESSKLREQLQTALARVTELEGPQDDDDQTSTDARTVAQLKEALDARGVQYEASAKKAALQEFAALNGI